jgi:DNA-binding transcriptional regulator YiaG
MNGEVPFAAEMPFFELCHSRDDILIRSRAKHRRLAVSAHDYGRMAQGCHRGRAKMKCHAQTVESLSTRLRRLAITQAEFADICEVTPRTVSNWVRGRTRVNTTALAFLEQIEASDELRWRLCIGEKIKGAPRGRPFERGNPYRFGDSRRSVAVAGSRRARAAA